jgi:hypothetical protein
VLEGGVCRHSELGPDIDAAVRALDDDVHGTGSYDSAMNGP